MKYDQNALPGTPNNPSTGGTRTVVVDGFHPSADPVDDTLCDFWVQNHGTLFLLIPQTEAAKEWVDEHLPDDIMTFGKGLVIEHRYIYDIVDGIRTDGLEVE